MTRDEALALAGQIADEKMRVAPWCVKHGRNYGTFMAQTHRAGVCIGTEVRWLILDRVTELRAQGWTAARASDEAGFASPQSYHRAAKAMRLRRAA